MRLAHVVPVRSAVFDEPNLVSTPGWVPPMGFASRTDLIELADRHMSVPGGAWSRGRVEGIRAGRGHGRGC